jgi:6-phospho-3-hexuloisomerase
MTTTSQRLEAVLDEMRGVFARMDADSVPRLAEAIVAAKRIFLYGAGRTGLVLQAFAMRLAHLGLDAHFVGQLSAPPAAGSDLFVVALAVGTLPTGDALAASARAAGAKVAVITARPQKVVGADLVVHLPAQIMADPMTSVLPLGSPFELALSLLCDLTVVELMLRLGRSNEDLAARHTNLL